MARTCQQVSPSPLPHAGAQLGELPSATMLGTVTEFAQHEATMAATQQQESLSSSAETTPHPIATLKPPSTVMLGTWLPSLPRKLIDKILAGEYVDFAELPPARGKARAVPQALEGRIVVVQAADLLQSRRAIPDLATWMQCYATFTAVIAFKNPARLPDLMAYMIIIAEASQKFAWPSWVVYDQNFRQEAACSTSSQGARVDPSGRTSAFRMRGGQTLTVGPPKHAALATPHDYCIKYNRFKGDCKFGTACRFPHICSTRKGPHPVLKCNNKRSKPSEATQSLA